MDLRPDRGRQLGARGLRAAGRSVIPRSLLRADRRRIGQPMTTELPERRRTEAGAAFAAYLDFDDVLRRVLPYAAEAAGAEATSLLLHDGVPAELVVAATAGPAGDSSRGRRFADSGGIAGAVLASARPRLVPD